MNLIEVWGSGFSVNLYPKSAVMNQNGVINPTTDDMNLIHENPELHNRSSCMPCRFYCLLLVLDVGKTCFIVKGGLSSLLHK
ncbi:hypothetical protein SDC9_54071 [bioreactor metagenome]|uniref:Uncharacterized protein n=1 Tax=bioreactor metagenome TaxID=1076179 RepID=A0A644X0R2_9ZZZZ